MFCELTEQLGVTVVDVASFGSAGRGVRVRQKVKAGMKLCSIPVSACFTTNAAKRGLPAALSELLDETHLLVIYLLLEKAKRDKSAYAAHILSLPSTYDRFGRYFRLIVTVY